MNRLSVNTVLKSMVGVLAFVLLIQLAIGAWSLWQKAVVSARMETVALASGHMFDAMPNLRIDRNNTVRALAPDIGVEGFVETIDKARKIEMPAVDETIEVLARAKLIGAAGMADKLTEATPRLKAVDEADATIETMNAITKPITEAVEGQGAATGESNVQEASIGTATVSDSITSVNVVAAESSDAAARVLTAASDLSQHAGEMRREIGALPGSIRAA